MEIQYIYIIKEREFVNSCESIYKIGKTTQCNEKRLKQYPKGSILIFQSICSNCSIVEKEIISVFNQKYIQRRDIGSEYFEGEYIEMIKDLLEIINNDCNNFNHVLGNTEKISKNTKISKDLSDNIVNFLNQNYEFITKEAYDFLPKLEKIKWVLNRVDIYNFWYTNSTIKLDRKTFYKILSENFTTYRTSNVRNGVLGKINLS